MIIRTLSILSLLITTMACTGIIDVPASRFGSDDDKAHALNPAPTQPDLAVVYIHRESSPLNVVNALVAIGDTRIASLTEGTFTRIELTPGTHSFRYVVHEPDFTAKVKEFNHHSRAMEIRAGVINLITMESTGLKLQKIRYLQNPSDELVHDADFRHPYRPRYAELVPGVEEAPAPKVVASVAPAPVEAKPAITATAFAALQKEAACKLKNANWVYTGTACKAGFAEGEGRAKDTQGLEFIGEFAAGERLKGEIHRDGKMIFAGALVDDKPEGSAICLHEGEYEECRYFRGKRIDSLYKMRIENNKLRAEMAKQQRVTPAAVPAGSAGNELTDYAVDALQKEATDRAADYIFDRFF